MKEAIVDTKCKTKKLPCKDTIHPPYHSEVKISIKLQFHIWDIGLVIVPAIDRTIADLISLSQNKIELSSIFELGWQLSWVLG